MAILLASVGSLALGGPALADSPQTDSQLRPGDLLVSTSVFSNDPNIVVGTPLPPGCGTNIYNTPCGFAVADGTYPYVFNNDTVDSHFGITSKIVLQELNPGGHLKGSIEVPNSSQNDIGPNTDQMVTSFSSKSELSLNLSTAGNYVTFMGYKAAVDTSDVSNASTPGVVDVTNPVVPTYYRVVAQLGQDGTFHYTETNAYSGDNGRAAILNEADNLLYTAGNAGNGNNPEPQGVVLGAGARSSSTRPLCRNRRRFPTNPRLWRAST